ncbi:MAG: outer membrane protein OmpK [Sulfurimonas sp.]|nr:outer membrane protein OmpK [Sulfurimonas sp.]
MQTRKHFMTTLVQSTLFISILFNISHADGVSTTKNILTPNYSFKNISLNYFDWSQKSENATQKRDFTYLELEGGAGWDWGEFYIFFDTENPLGKYEESSSDAQRFAFKPIADITLYKNLALHIHDYNFHSNDYYIHNLITGVSYKIVSDSGWLRPFIGSHYQESSYYSGYNGIMAGWTFLYNFSLAEQKFSLSNWHEMTFARNEKDGYANKNGLQGSLALWWHPLTQITTGLQYRYADNELGSATQEGFIYSVKYNF